jgi:beta-galactosidase
MKKTTLIFFAFVISHLFLLSRHLFAQELVLGGLQGDKTLILTPSIAENTKILGKTVYEIPYLGFTEAKDTKHDLEFAPTLPKDWNWIGIFNATVKGKKRNVFYYDSWVGTAGKSRTNGRRRDFPNDITAKIKSNCYHIGLQREFVAENETFLFVVSPKKQKVIIELPKEIFKTNRRLEYEMNENEAKFIHIVIPPAEYTVVTWQENKHLRKKIPFNQDWKFFFGEAQGAETMTFDDKKWEQMSLPHTWNGMKVFDLRNIRDTIDVIEMFKRGVGWYRKKFKISSAENKDKHFKINFLAANQVAQVWLNGKYVGKHIGGYTDFHFGLNEHLLLDKENILAVKVDNRFDFDIPPHTADYNFQGGIYREVEFEIWNQYFIKDIKITTQNVNFKSADFEVTTIFNNKSKANQKVKLVTNLINPYNEIALSQVLEVNLPAEKKDTVNQVFTNFKNPQLWSPENPILYRIVSTMYDENGKAIDEKSESFGFRKIEFTADKGFFINDIYTKLKGVNAHQDSYGTGWAMDSTAKRRDYVLMKEMGVNFIRMSHYPHHPYELYLCDSLGIMVWAEIPVVNSVGTENFVKNAEKMMEEMILRDKNHPSIVMWGVGNEYYRESFTPDVVEWALKCTEAVTKKVKALDPYRPTVQAQNDLVDNRIMELTDIQGRNRYFGWYTGADVYEGLETFSGFGKIMDKEHQDKPNWKILVSEYGAEGKYGFHVSRPMRFDHSESYQIAFHKAYWDYISKNDWVLGSTLWNMFDFSSWAKIGNIPHINQKGMMTYDRKPKSVYYFYQSQWTSKPMVYINSHTWTHRTGEKGAKQEIEVFSNCENVELFVNGISQGKRLKSESYTWKVDFKEGANEVKALAYKEGETVKTNMQIYFSFETEKTKKAEGADAD